MSATTNWFEQNGAANGTPAHGTESAISSCDWKNVDDTTTPRSSAPVLASENSYDKKIYLKFSGTFNQISAVKFAHTDGTLGTGISLVGKVTSTYTAPSTSPLSSATDMTTPIGIGSGASVLLGTSGPNDTNPSASQTMQCYTQYLVTQVQTTAAAAAGDSGTVTLKVQYNEN
jgi:hypothetical protein